MARSWTATGLPNAQPRFCEAPLTKQLRLTRKYHAVAQQRDTLHR